MSSTAKTAIVLIDPYNEFLHPEGKVNQLIAESMADTNTIFHLKNLVTAARAHKIPIYYGLHQQVKAGFLAGWNHATSMQEAQKENKVFEEGTWGVEIFEGLEPDVEGNADVVVSKHWCSSSFQNTDLEYQLRQRDITHLVFAGLTANTCMESTARYAFELRLLMLMSGGYRVTMLKDATAGFSTVVKDAGTDLIWPLFANEVLTVEEWKKSLEK